ncbi:MAG: DUF3987 domain-containing protein [Lacipirellulaceae bacterium]
MNPSVASENETWVLGSLLIDPSLAGEVLTVVEPDEFLDPTRRAICAAIARRHAAGEPIDAALVLAEVPSDLAADARLALTRAAEVPTAAHGLAYAKLVADAARGRRLAGEAERALRRTRDGASTSEVLESLRAVVDAESSRAAPPPRPAPAWAPFPVHALPDCLANMVRSVARSAGVDESIPAMAGLTVAAAAIGATRSVAVKEDHREPCILWGAVVADSGDGKTPGAAPMIAVANAHDIEAAPRNADRLAEHGDAMREFKADEETWKAQRKKGGTEPPPRPPEPPPIERYVVQDATPESLGPLLADNPRGLLSLRDELSGAIGGMDRYSGGRGGAERAQWLSLWSAEPLRIDRKTGERRSLLVPEPHASLFGGIQPGLLFRSISGDDVAAGLPARFLWAWPPPQPIKYRDDRIPTAHREAYKAAIDQLYAIEADADEFGAWRPVVVGLTAQARRVYADYVNALGVRREQHSGPVRGGLSKMRGQVGRVALVLHLLRVVAGEVHDGAPIDADTMTAAVRLAEWFENEAVRVFSLRGETTQDAEAREVENKVAAAIAQLGEATARDVRQKVGALKTTEQAEEVLRRLVEAGRVERIDQPPGPRGGRPTWVYRSATAKPKPKPHQTRCSEGFGFGLATSDTESDPDPLTFAPDGSLAL